MATIEVFQMGTQFGDSASHLASDNVNVSAVDGRAYVAAANDGARAATKVGLLMIALSNLTDAASGDAIKQDSVTAAMVNSTFGYQSKDAQIYNSNRWRITGMTTNGAGLPVRDSFTVPQRAELTPMADNGENLPLTQTQAAAAVVQILDTALSRYNTPYTSVLEIIANDS